MDPGIRWTILIPSVVTRDEELKTLIKCLEPQVDAFEGDIRVMVYWNNFELELGKLRQKMIEDAQGEYVSFIDDDDLVSEDYCRKIYPLLDGVDYIGFRVKYTQSGILQKPVIHSLAAEGWMEDDKGFYRQATHLNPIKRSIALKARYDRGDYYKGIPEDITYSEAASKLCKTENYVDEELYYYQQRPGKSVFNRFSPAEGEFQKPVLPRYFYYQKDSTES